MKQTLKNTGTMLTLSCPAWPCLWCVCPRYCWSISSGARCAQWFLPGARCWRTMMHAAGKNWGKAHAWYRCQDVRRKYAQDRCQARCQSEAPVSALTTTCPWHWQLCLLSDLLIDRSTRLHRYPLLQYVRACMTTLIRKMGWLSIIILNVKRSHHLHREGLEIPTLIQKKKNIYSWILWRSEGLD
jgi:hypothetical protein